MAGEVTEAHHLFARVHDGRLHHAALTFAHALRVVPQAPDLVHSLKADRKQPLVQAALDGCQAARPRADHSHSLLSSACAHGDRDGWFSSKDS